jgi:LuxR family transcriptional regulator, maltose regulon positive regulatory protein
LIGSYAPQLLAQGRNLTLDEWFTHLPESILQANPWLLFWKGASRSLFNPPQSREWLAMAYDIFVSQKDVSGQFFACAGVLDSLAAEQDNLSLVDPWIPEVERLLRDHVDAITPEIEGRLISGAMAIMIRAAGHPLMRDFYVRARRLIAETTDPDQCIRAACFAALFLTWRARFPEARELVNEVNIKLRRNTPSPAWRAFWKMWEGVAVFYGGGFQQAIDLLEEGLRIGAETGVRIWDFFHYLLGSHAAMSMNDMALAKEYIKKIEATLNPHQRLHVALLAFDKSTFALLGGNYVEALAHAERGLKLHRQIGAPYHEAIVKLAVVQALAALERFDDVEPYLASVHHWVNQLDSKSSWVVVPALLTEANISLLRGDTNRALKATVALFSAMKEYAIVAAHPVWAPEVMARVCEFALQNNIEPEFVKELIRIRNIQAPSVGSDIWPRPIKIRVLGNFNIQKEDEPITFRSKAQKKPLEVLKTLAALGGCEIDTRSVIDIVWPAPSTEDADAALNTNLHRLRKLLGEDDFILLKRRKLSLNPSKVWVDVQAFDSLTADNETVYDRLQRAFTLYTGDLLAEDALPPTLLTRREQLRSRLRTIVSKLGQLLENQRDYQGAIAVYRRAVKLDSLSEEYYRRLMLCHYEIGNFSEGIHVYRRCREHLSVVLNARLSEETENIHKQLRSRMAQ